MCWRFVEMESGWCLVFSPRPFRWWSFHFLLPGYWRYACGRKLWTQMIAVGPVIVALTDLTWEVAFADADARAKRDGGK